MKIGILGGSFNPPHNGHLNIAKKCAAYLGLDKVLIIPSNIAPHKSSAAYADAKDRLNMCRLAFTDSLFDVSDIELRSGDLSYTLAKLS